jgi:hypothetical protein
MRRQIVSIFIVLAALAVLIVGPVQALIADPGFINFSFEMKKQSDPEKPSVKPWTIANKTGDKIICTDAPEAYEGACAFRFKGSAAENSVLSQAMTEGNIETLNGQIAAGLPDQYLCATYHVYSNSLAAKLRGTLKIKLEGEPAHKVKLSFNGSTDERGRVPAWQPRGCAEVGDNGIVTITSDDVVQAVSIKFINRSLAGEFFLDYVLFKRVSLV